MNKIESITDARKPRSTRVIPITVKIILVFTVFILVSNFTTNYINLTYNKTELFKQMNQLLTKDLKDIYAFCNNQYEIYQYDKKLDVSIQGIEKKGVHELKNSKAIVLGVKPDASILFQASKISRADSFTDTGSIEKMRSNLENGIDEGLIHFVFKGEQYFGMYKFNKKWDAYIIRAEEHDEFYSETSKIFRNITIMIIFITIVIMVIGILVLRYLLRYIGIITQSIRKMINSQQLGLIEMGDATNDDITYLGTAFNSLSSTVDNLISIFRKFANQDIVQKAYREREVKLEGTRKELTILFTDIKSFTFITETLGTDIIKLLNLHYDRAIREIINYEGVIGSIIGDALLAVYGALEDSDKNKSLMAVQSAYKLHDVTRMLWLRMEKIKAGIEKERGKLTKDEEKVFKAVMLEIGVGLDGGEVFYGTLGSYVRMTNTVIGDNVNAASRLEGLTRIYHVPVICSEYVRDDIEKNIENHGIHFLEIDTVLVKGKTTGKKIYWPIPESEYDEDVQKQITSFELGLELYYNGDWSEARKKFMKVSLPVADVFKERTKEKCPKNWNGIWEMKTK
jgi:class 3 adenylate cyclase